MDFERALAAQFFRVFLCLFAAGGVVFLGGYLLIGWLIENLTILWG